MIKICECGCGKEFMVNKRWLYRKIKQRFISGHNLRLKEVIEKMKQSIKTPEHRFKLHLLGRKRFLNGGYIPSRKGLVSPRKGKHCSEETKEKLRLFNLGKHHTQETKDKCKRIAFEKGYGKWMLGKKLSKETCLKKSIIKRGIMPKNNYYPGKFRNVKRGYFDINGKNIFLRSKWEANYALYLDFLISQKQISKWEYEADCFLFEKIKLGTKSYRPDFKIYNNNGTIEYHEIKGWMDSKSKTKINRMRIYYPKIKLIVIDSKAYTNLKNQIGKMLKFY